MVSEQRQARAAERRAWAEAHGSAYLRRALAEGYDCQRLYVEERARIELPGYELDFYGRAAWQERSCPTEAALDESLRVQGLGYNARVYWLTVSPDGDTFPDEEAVIVTAYLGRYTLIRTYGTVWVGCEPGDELRETSH